MPIEAHSADFQIDGEATDDRGSFAERGAVLGIGKRIGHGALRHRYTHNAIGYAREVQYFEDQINSGVSGAEQIAFACFELYFSGGNRAGGDFVFKPPDEIVELAIFAIARHEEQ